MCAELHRQQWFCLVFVGRETSAKELCLGKISSSSSLVRFLPFAFTVVIWKQFFWLLPPPWRLRLSVKQKLLNQFSHVITICTINVPHLWLYALFFPKVPKRWMQVGRHLQYGALSRCTWTETTMEWPTPAKWTMWHSHRHRSRPLKYWRSTVSLHAHMEWTHFEWRRTMNVSCILLASI